MNIVVISFVGLDVKWLVNVGCYKLFEFFKLMFEWLFYEIFVCFYCKWVIIWFGFFKCFFSKCFVFCGFW